MEIIFKGSPNYNKRTKPVTRIVIHWFGSGTLESADRRFQNRDNKVSAHYGISKSRIWQWVKESDVAWHSGVFEVNQDSIGIEHDAIKNGHDLSEEDYRLSAQLVAEIAKRHNIPLDRAHIIGHKEVKATQCPGTINIDKIIQLAKPMTIQLPLTIVANNNKWETLSAQLAEVTEWFNRYSDGKLNVTFDVVKTSFNDVPLAPFADKKSVDVNWYRNHITPLVKGKGSIFLLNPDQYQNGLTFAFMTYGDAERPVRMEVSALENEAVANAPVFVHRAFHEVCHMLFFLTGQKDFYTVNGEQRFVVHDYLYQEADKKAELLALIDYEKLKAALDKIRPSDKIKIRALGWSDVEKGIYFPFDSIPRREELLSKLTALFPDYELDPTEFNLGKRPW